MRRRRDIITHSDWQITISILLVILLGFLYVYDKLPKVNEETTGTYHIGLTLVCDSIISNKIILVKLDSIQLFEDSIKKIRNSKEIEMELMTGRKTIALYEAIIGKYQLIKTDTIDFEDFPINQVMLYFHDAKQEQIDFKFFQHGLL
jgi:hypothetical protein